MSDPGSLHLLGAIRIERDGVTIPLRGSQCQLLLSYLALDRDRPVPVEELSDVLWGDHPGEHWRGALRGLVAKVRTFLDPLETAVCLEGHRNSYSLHWVDPPPIDLVRAERLEATARQALLDADHEAAATAATEAARALAEPLLPGVEADWLSAPRARQAETCRQAHRTAARAWSALGRHDLAVVAAEAAVRSDPYDEVSQRTLLTTHLAAGNRTAGLRAYERFRQLATTELGVDPDERTQALYLHLLGPPTDAIAAGGFDDEGDPFVGRETELSVIAGAWAVAQSGRRMSVALHGGAGEGKTRLALEAAHRTGATVLYGRCTSERAIPYQPFVEAIEAHLSALDDDRRDRIVGDLGAALQLLGTGPGDGERRPPGPGSDTDPLQRSIAFDAVATAVRRIAATPIVLVIDDVHWADAATHRLARHLLRSLEEDPVLVLTTFRDDEPPDEELARTVTELHRLGRYRTLPVGGLTPEDVAVLLRRSGPAGPAEAAALHERTGGNPLYLGQLIRARKEAGVDDGEAVPATVRELIAHRTATLDPAAHLALDVASVLGTTMTGQRLDAVLAIAGTPTDAVDRLVERRFLVELGGDRLRFDHVIVRDAVYGQLPDRKRRRLHSWVARVLDGGDEDVDPAVLAHHYEAAGDDDDVHSWYEAMRRTADHAMRVHAYEQAVTWTGRILGLVGRRPEAGPVLDVLLLRGAAQRRAGDLVGATATLREARQLALDEGASDHVADAVLELVGHAGRGADVHLLDTERAALLREAVEVLGSGSPQRRAALLAEQALALLLISGRSDEVARIAAQARRIASAAHDPQVDADTMVAGRLLHPTPDRAGDRRQQIDALVDEHGHRLSEEQLIRLQLWRVTDCFELGDRVRLDVELASLARMAEMLDQRYWGWIATTWQAIDRFVQGDEGEAEALTAQALAAVEPIGHPEPPLAHGIQIVGFRLRQGRGPEIADVLDQVSAGAPDIPGLRCARVAALASAGRREEARAEIDAILADDLRALPRDTTWGPSLVLLAEGCHDASAPEAAVALLPLLHEFRGRFVTANAFGAGGACHAPYDEAIALVHRCTGAEDAARQAFDDALAACRRFGAHGLARHIERRAAQRRPST
ncbi:AAA family ATPase [Acidimicrobiia bacterium EGI L10123]|uniref:ATP-binding protein n=1 Tax=Salinilacustrithrix flava TaxID=2957203 RepID=UPI003D7C2BE1|nr:AAA family ATPase [Acidimicrobiia bacterium EGI L10123]